MVVDSKTAKVLGDIREQGIAHGVAIVPEVGRGFISDSGGAGAVVVFDLESYPVLGKVVAQPDVDGIPYDPILDRILAVSGDAEMTEPKAATKGRPEPKPGSFIVVVVAPAGAK